MEEKKTIKLIGSDWKRTFFLKHIKPFKLENKNKISYINNKKNTYRLNPFRSGGNLTYYANKFIHIYNAINQNQSFNFIRELFR